MPSAKKRCLSGMEAFSEAGGLWAEGGRRGSLMTPGKRNKQEGQTGTCETQVWKDSPGGKDGNPFWYTSPGESPWTEEPGKLQSIGLQRVDMTEVIKHVCTHTSLQIAPNS